MANKSLTDLTARTATADSDLIHVNSGGTDYKETKANFSANLAKWVDFGNSSALTTQIDALAGDCAYEGLILSYGHQTETGVPINANFYVDVIKIASGAGRVKIYALNSSAKPVSYINFKSGGAWQGWVQDPTRDEITSLNNSLTNSLPTSAIVAITPTGCSNYDNYGNSYYYKRGNQVFVHIGVKGLTPNTPTDIFSLPSGYRPYTNYVAVGGGGESYLATSFISIYTNGGIRITSSDHYAIIDGCFTVFS